MRHEIQELWRELSTSTAIQQEEYPLFFVDYTDLEDDAFSVHQDYLTKLQNKIKQLLIQKVERREAIVQERLGYEKLIMNPERYVRVCVCVCRQ